MTAENAPGPAYRQAIFETGPADRQRGETVLDGLCDAVAVLPLPSGWRLEGLLRSDLDPDRLAGDWPSLCVAAGYATPPVLEIAPLPDRDWVAESQRRLSPVKAGRFTAYGTHDRGRVPPGRSGILIDAGQAFGTGHHASTRGCLSALQRLSQRRPGRVLDFGCGSGILAIAAARIGHAHVTAADIDPLAVAETRRNAIRNRVGERVRPLLADSPSAGALGRAGPFDLTLANILARPLVDMAAGLGRLSRPGGFLVLAGFLRQDHRMVLNAYLCRGFRLFWRIEDDGWTTLILRRGARRDS